MKPPVWNGTLKEMRALAPEVVQLSIALPEDFAFEAGQYVEVRSPQGDGEAMTWFPFSIASGPSHRPLELCVKKNKGYLKEWVEGLSLGAALEIRGPGGSFRYAPEPKGDVCFIATGTGIAPLRAMLQSEVYRASLPRRTMLLFGAFRHEEVLYHEEWKVMQEEGLELVLALSDVPQDDPWTGFRGWVTEYLRQHEEQFDWRETDFHICGHPAMLKEVREILQGHGVAENALHHERW